MKHYNQLANIADAIISSREFCGNEREAFIEACHDEGIRPTVETKEAVYSIVNGAWAQYQAEAGVTLEKRISSNERARINRVMNNAE